MKQARSRTRLKTVLPVDMRHLQTTLKAKKNDSSKPSKKNSCAGKSVMGCKSSEFSKLLFSVMCALAVYHVRAVSLPEGALTSASYRKTLSTMSKEIDFQSTLRNDKKKKNLRRTSQGPLEESAIIDTEDFVQTEMEFESKDNDVDLVHSSIQVSPLRHPLDYEKFTIRINATWKREEHLKASIEHHATCSAVAQIQIIWREEQGEPPKWLLQMEEISRQQRRHGGGSIDSNNLEYFGLSSVPSIVIERHVNNTMNERFLALEEIPTAGVMSIDDNILRPCISIHAAFVKWSHNPDRQVGFDARSHAIQNDGTDDESWAYVYKTAAEEANEYSITLSRYTFFHQDYLHSYWNQMPSSIRGIVEKYSDCEDIAMSLWITANTNAQPPLLADFWAIQSEVSLYVPPKTSGETQRKDIRDKCVDIFAETLQLKGLYHPLTLRHHDHDHDNGAYEYGSPASDWNKQHHISTTLVETEVRSVVENWKENGGLLKELTILRKKAAFGAYQQGLIENTQPWKEKHALQS